MFKPMMRLPQMRVPRGDVTPASVCAPFLRLRVGAGAALTAAALALASTSTPVWSDGEVTSLATSDRLGTPFRFTVDDITYTWGIGRNQILDGFTLDGQAYQFASEANRVMLQRDDVSDVATGIPCGVFAEQFPDADNALAANYPSDGTDSGNCDMASMLASRVVNRGALDLFSNRGPLPKNVERADYVFEQGINAPFSASALSGAGHLMGEKRGNNPIQVAAILSLDVLGQPATFGPLVPIRPAGSCTGDDLCYGLTDIVHQYDFFQSSSTAPQGFPSQVNSSVETVTMNFTSLERLGLNAGQRYHGISLFPIDVDASVHTLTDPATFPNDTGDPNVELDDGDGADIYGGVGGYFVADALSVGSGRVFVDLNGNGASDEGEAGLANIGIRLIQDVDSDGIYDAAIDQSLGDPIESGITGDFVVPGLPDGAYFLVLDESDPDLVPGIRLASGNNPLPFIISGADRDDLNFVFSNISGDPNNGGDTSGSTDSGNGNGDSGNGDAGNGDAGNGNSDSGGDTGLGGVDSGGTDSGSTDSSGGDAGSDAGNTDSGNASGGGSTAGGTDSGITDSGATDSGATDSGATDSGSTDSGSTDSGSTDSGSTDSGNTDSSGTDAGMTDSGATDSGATDSGATDSGATDSGATDSGATDSGATDSGSTDSGSTDSGNTDGGNSGGNLVTTANTDSVSTQQGTTVLIDVLDNDVDGSGLGLEIIEVTESPNASISIVDNQISYTPNFDFFGTDSFLYVIRDGDNVEDSGTVEVSVTRFSDINNNGINDFDECNCTNLTLETGVHGSGLGHVMPMSLLVLGLAVWRRRWMLTRRRVALENTTWR